VRPIATATPKPVPTHAPPQARAPARAPTPLHPDGQ
jgi:hypothetical protein